MRINVYSQELTDEVIHVRKESNTGIVYDAAQLVLHSSPMLHHPPQDDDRSAVTFWLPRSPKRREAMARAFEEIARVFRTAPVEAEAVNSEGPEESCPKPAPGLEFDAHGVLRPSSRESAKTELSDEKLEAIALRAILDHGDERIRASMTYESGPYYITRVNHWALKILRAVLRAAGGKE